jgi:DNA repair protein RadC
MTHLEKLDKKIEVHQSKIGALHAVIGRKYLHIILFLSSVAVVWMLLGRVDIGMIFGIVISIPIPALVIYEIIISIYDSRNTISKNEHDQIKAIRKEIKGFEQKMLYINETFPRRTKGARFKKFHELKSSTIDQIEELLPKAMYNEHKEVSVTLFIKNNIAIRAAANLGNLASFRTTDNVFKWGKYARDHGCSEVRDYHNHPGRSTSFGPSAQDLVFFENNRKRLNAVDVVFRCFIICWNLHSEWKIIEYSANNPTVSSLKNLI